jgi:anti-sigma-K factor RskA
MTCEGFSPATYDLYVLGLLDQDQRAAIDAHVQQQCPGCVSAIQRSMSLWFVFASTLQNAEPSEGFKARLSQIANLSKRVLTFPRSVAPVEENRPLRWFFIALGSILLVVLTIGGWYAGHTSEVLQEQRLTNEVAQLTQTLASVQLQLDQEKNRRQQAVAVLKSSNKGSAVSDTARLQSQLLEAQAAANQYKSQLDRQQRNTDDNSRLLTALSAPGAHLIPLKDATGSSPTLSAYVLVVPNSKLILVGWNFPRPAEGREYQVWITKKQDSTPISAGAFAPEDDSHGLLESDDGSLASDISSIAVTDEPLSGSSAPSGTKLLVSNGIT